MSEKCQATESDWAPFAICERTCGPLWEGARADRFTELETECAENTTCEHDLGNDAPMLRRDWNDPDSIKRIVTVVSFCVETEVDIA